MIPALTIGDGVPLVPPGSMLAAKVISQFRHGFYLNAQNRIFAIGGPQIPAGPIHLVLATSPPKLAENSLITLATDKISTERENIDLSRARHFSPDSPSPKQLRRIRPILAHLATGEYLPDGICGVIENVKKAVRTENLDGARRLLQGRGDGLTPSGDDVLAGLLLYFAWARQDTAETSLIANHAETTDLSRAFLHWAARGQSIQPVHDMIDAALTLSVSVNESARETDKRRFGDAVASVASIGASSGKALLAGLGLASALNNRFDI